jgi:hypothetical protein
MRDWRGLGVVPFAAAIGIIGACGTGAADRAQDRREILRDYEAIKAAHFHRDAAAFLAPYDSGWMVVSGGSATARTHASAQPALQMYLDSISFTEITDVDPPRIEIATDGSMAWMLGHVRIRGQRRHADGASEPIGFESAFVDVWRKHAGQWRIIAHANTERDSV